jgi:hypothetical protein
MAKRARKLKWMDVRWVWQQGKLDDDDDDTVVVSHQ